MADRQECGAEDSTEESVLDSPAHGFALPRWVRGRNWSAWTNKRDYKRDHATPTHASACGARLSGAELVRGADRDPVNHATGRVTPRTAKAAIVLLQGDLIIVIPARRPHPRTEARTAT
jgi:hypothetical protein